MKRPQAGGVLAQKYVRHGKRVHVHAVLAHRELLQYRKRELKLVDLGYTGVPALTLSRKDDVRHLIDAAGQFPGPQSALCVGTDCSDIALELGRTVRFAVQPQHNRVLQQLLCGHGVRTLKLPASLSRLRFLIIPDVIAQQPALETLVLERAGQRTHDDCVPFAQFLKGMILAPALARIRIIAARDAREYRVLKRVEVATATGVELNGDIDELRGCVGTLII